MADSDVVYLGSVLDELEAARREEEIGLARELTKTSPAATAKLEAAVIASILEEGDDAVAVAVERGLTPEAFHTPTLGLVFRLCCDLRESGGSVHRVTIEDLALERGLLGGELKMATLDRLLSSVESPPSVHHSAAILVGLAQRRELYRVLREHEAQLRTGRKPDEVLDSAQQSLMSLAQNRRSSGHVDLAETVREALKEMPAAGGVRRVVPTGLEMVDNLMGGYAPSEFCIIAARPSMGKTALALSITHRVAKRGVPVAFFSLEMGAKSLMQRLVAVDSSVPPRATPTSASIARVTGSAARLAEMPLFIDDTARHLADIRARARRLRARHGVGMILIDYIQLVKVPAREQRVLEVGEVSRSLKELAAELDIPVVALSQLNRGVEGRAERRPMLSDLRESGDLEQDADVVQLLYREGYYRRDDQIEKSEAAELNTAKNRNGPTGTVKLAYRGSIPSFADLDWRDSI